MKRTSQIVITLPLLLISFLLSAKEGPTKKSTAETKAQSLFNKAENCFPPTAFFEEELNNVNYGISTGGLLWNENTNPKYEVPKGAGVHSLFAGGLWMGGKSPDGNLKLAAVTFGQNGTDYWPGPLSLSAGDASNALCQEYDQHYKARLVDVQLHNLWFERVECVNTDGCDPSILTDPPFENGYTMPDYFNEWPGNNFTQDFALRLAPFGERESSENGIYEPNEGDYPGYDLTGDIDCRARGPEDDIPLFGDETIWWVFNDAGGIHTESSDGEPIGMEIQAQSFVYSTTDEINNMTFYNYVLINRGGQTLLDTYFGQYADPDIGCATNDYVGCDVTRGLGYAYNGTDFDESCSGSTGYGSNSPIVGIDFFEGPYIDIDGRNNEIDSLASSWETTVIGDIVVDQGNIPYQGLGLGYFNPAEIVYDELGNIISDTDRIIDNERFGMSKFIYYTNGADFPTRDPEKATEFYNYLTGKWQNGAPFTYGGTGIGGTTPCSYVLPGDSDYLNYGTNGIEQDPWSERNASPGGNEPEDRRFLQSSGPFTLEPGEFNNITVGVVWAQAPGGDEELLSALFAADDKAQALFDNCFRILNGPGAPGVAIQELDQEIILYLTETEDSENYIEEDPSIPSGEDNKYRFEGYKVFQLASNAVSSGDLNDPDKARLIYQVDLENGVDQLVNYIEDQQIGAPIPTLMVQGSDEGIQHSFKVNQDAFSGSSLVNYKQYYFMTISYGYNEFQPYQTNGSGQNKPYLEGRLSFNGSSIPVVTGIPHKTESEQNGSVITASYGQVLPMTRIEGTGTGKNFLELSQESTDEVMSGFPWIADELKYDVGGAPINIKVIDPLNVKEGDFTISFYADNPSSQSEIDPEETKWVLKDEDDNILAESNKTINIQEEFLLMDYGISIEVVDAELEELNKPEFLGATMVFEDSEMTWLTGVPDRDNNTEQNWIRSGQVLETCDSGNQLDSSPEMECYYNDVHNGNNSYDPESEYEGILEGMVSPWILAGNHWSGPKDRKTNYNPIITGFQNLNNVDIVLTNDKEKWTRVPVLETQEFDANTEGGLSTKGYPRVALSVDKNGKNILQGGDVDEITGFGAQALTQEYLEVNMEEINNDPDFKTSVIAGYKEILWPGDGANHPDADLYGHSFGYGWFPGYAIDVETGERLNMAFGENSNLVNQNGADMIWNPTSDIWNPNVQQQDPLNARFGGMHYVYIFRNEDRRGESNDKVSSYDNAKRIFDNIYGGRNNGGERGQVIHAITWTMLPLLHEDFELETIENGLIPTKTTIKLRVAKPFQRFPTIAKYFDDEYLTDDGLFNYEQNDLDLYQEGLPLSENDWFPKYSFSTKGFTTLLNDNVTASTALDLINVVPNPYMAFSLYETSRLDNRVKFINLPEECSIRIFNTAGTLVRTLGKDNDLTYLDWDLKNENNITVSGGAYIIHVSAPGIGAKTIKWYGVTRKVDLDNF